jgi:hypothetical protein
VIALVQALRHRQRLLVERLGFGGRAGGSDAAAQAVAIAELVRMYAPALRAHLLQFLHYDEHRADDLLRGFLAEKVLEQRLIGYADPARGRPRLRRIRTPDRWRI